MTEEQISGLFGGLFKKRSQPIQTPTDEDWRFMTSRFGCDFSADYKLFIQAAANFWVPLEIYDPLAVRGTSGNGTVAEIYDVETKLDSSRDRNLVPMCGLANGDLFCIRTASPIAEEVFFVFHEDGSSELSYNTVEDWIRDLANIA